MGQPSSPDVGIDAFLLTGLVVVFTPITGIGDQCQARLSGVGNGEFQHGFQMLLIRRLIADAHCHYYLIVAIVDRLAVLALQEIAITLHVLIVGIGEIQLCS